MTDEARPPQSIDAMTNEELSTHLFGPGFQVEFFDFDELDDEDDRNDEEASSWWLDD
jgi:hypothetical protein